jgi:hypothetical protein
LQLPDSTRYILLLLLLLLLLLATPVTGGMLSAFATRMTGRQDRFPARCLDTRQLFADVACSNTFLLLLLAIPLFAAVACNTTGGMLSAFATRMTDSQDLFAARWDGGLPGGLAAGWRPAFGINALEPPLAASLLTQPNATSFCCFLQHLSQVACSARLQHV